MQILFYDVVKSFLESSEDKGRQIINTSGKGILRCSIPDDCIDSNRYPLFMARAVLQELIESLQSISGVQPC